MNNLESAVAELVVHKAEAAIAHLSAALYRSLGVKPSKAKREHVVTETPAPAPKPRAPRKPRAARASRVETTSASKVSTTLRKRQPVRESVKPPPAPAATKRRGKDITGATVGSFVAIEPTGEVNNQGNAKWLFRCSVCKTERVLTTGDAAGYRSKGLTPRCACSKPAPKADRPTPAASPAPATVERVPAKPRTPIAMTRQQGQDLTGAQLGSYRAIGKTNERRLGQVVWMFRCAHCGAERLWTAFNVNSIRKKNPGFKCTCQGGSKPQSTGRVPVRLEPPTWSGRGRPPEHVRLQRERDALEKPVDDMDPDELDAAVLAEFERDRSLPRLRAEGDERRAPRSLLDEPSDDEDDEDDEEDAELDRAAGDEDD